MNETDLNHLMICAFRYALSRKSYITDVIASILIQHQGSLFEDSKWIIIKEIERAIETKNYGMEIDKDVWLNLTYELLRHMAQGEKNGRETGN